MKERTLTQDEIKRLADAGIKYPWSPWQSLELLDKIAERVVATERCDHNWQAPPDGQGPSVCSKCECRAPDAFKPGATLTFEFPDEDAADDFKTWLCDGGGEQQFWCDRKRFVHFDWFQGSIVPCEWRESE